MSEPVVDADTGRVALTRAHLAALVEHATGRTQVDALPVELQAVVRAGSGSGVNYGPARRVDVHPLLRPILGTLTAVRCRGVLRRWVGRPRPPVELLVGGAGVVVLPGGPEPDVLQELRWHPRPSAVARIVGELLDLPTEDGPPPFDRRPRPWAELITAASDPETGVGLADLRWSDRPHQPAASVLVVAWHQQGGIVAVEPATSPADRGGPTSPADPAAPATPATPASLAGRRGSAPGSSAARHDDRGEPPGPALADPGGRDSSDSDDSGDTDPAGPGGDANAGAASDLVRCSPRHPVEVWTGLTKLAGRAGIATTGAVLMV